MDSRITYEMVRAAAEALSKRYIELDGFGHEECEEEARAALEAVLPPLLDERDGAIDRLLSERNRLRFGLGRVERERDEARADRDVVAGQRDRACEMFNDEVTAHEGTKSETYAMIRGLARAHSRAYAEARRAESDLKLAVGALREIEQQRGPAGRWITRDIARDTLARLDYDDEGGDADADRPNRFAGSQEPHVTRGGGVSEDAVAPPETERCCKDCGASEQETDISSWNQCPECMFLFGKND